LINEAAIAATMANKEFVEQADLEEARDKVRWGRARKSREIDEKEKEMTAYHEAGHALVQVLLPDADPLHKVSIIPRGQSGGATFALPEKDRHMYSRKWCESYIRVCIAGRIAEEMFCGDIDSGAASDIAQATELARRMVKDWGMSDKLGFVRYAPGPQQQGTFADMISKEYSDRTAETIDEEVKSIMDRADQETAELLEANREKAQNIAQALLKYETLDAEDVQSIIDGEVLDKPTVDDLLEAEQPTSDGPPAEGSQVPQTPSIPEPPPGTIPEPS
jgi:cell division protease FtsH